MVKIPFLMLMMLAVAASPPAQPAPPALAAPPAAMPGASSTSPSGDASSGVSFGTGWIESYDDGMKVAHARKSPVLLDFRAEWCGPCRMMERQTFSDPAILSLLANFVCIRIDVDKRHETAMAWRVSGIPRVIVLNLHDQVVVDALGFRPPEALAPQLTEALSHAGEKQAQAAQPPTAPPDEPAKQLGDQLATASGDGLTSAVVELLSLIRPEERQKGLEQVARHAGRLRPVLRKLLGHERLAVRIGALEALEKSGEAKLVYDPWDLRAKRSEALARLGRIIVPSPGPGLSSDSPAAPDFSKVGL